MGLDGAHLDESVCGGPLDRVPAVVSGQARRSAQAEAPVLLQGLGALEPHLHRGTVRPKGRGLVGLDMKHVALPGGPKAHLSTSGGRGG